MSKPATTPEYVPSVVLVHGLWFPGRLLAVLARRLRRSGFNVSIFSYPSVQSDLTTNAARFSRYLETLDAKTVHLVGHSLGGVLIRALLHYHPVQKPGRVVTLGTPHGGSRVAARLSRYGFWRRLMGKGIAQWLAPNPEPWEPPPRDVGVICGTRSFGMGKLLVRDLPRPNDGLLTVKESAYAAAHEHLALPVSHTGMLFSRRVARQVATFLKTGHFAP